MSAPVPGERPGEHLLSRTDVAIRDLLATLAAARAPRETPADPGEDDDTVPATWPGLVSILDRHYPPDVFTGSSGDQGPRIVALARDVAGLRAQVAAVRKVAARIRRDGEGKPIEIVTSGIAEEFEQALDGSGEAPADPWSDPDRFGALSGPAPADTPDGERGRAPSRASRPCPTRSTRGGAVSTTKITCLTVACDGCGAGLDNDESYTPHFDTRAQAVTYLREVDWEAEMHGPDLCPVCVCKRDGHRWGEPLRLPSGTVLRHCHRCARDKWTKEQQ